MTRSPLLLWLTLLAGCATTVGEQPQQAPPPPPPAPAPPPPPPSEHGPPALGAVTGGRIAAACPLTIAFSSHGAGIDNPVREQVQSLLVADRAVAGFEAQRWGREGEVTLCVRTRAALDAMRLFHQVRAMIPSRPRGPITLRTLNGLSYDTPPPRR